MRPRRWAPLALVAFAAMAMFVPTTAADVDGDCRIMINGQDVGVHDADDGTPIRVPANGTIHYRVESDVPLRSWTLRVSYAGASVKVHEETFPPNSTVVEGAADASEFAWAGTGVYRVHGEAVQEDGTNCGAAALVHLSGSLLNATTAVAAAAVIAGGAGLSWMFIQILLQVREVKDAIDDFKEGYDQV